MIAMTKQPGSLDDTWAGKLEAVSVHQDKQAFAELFNFFAPKIKAFVMYGYENSISSQMAEEITQEVMIKVWRKADSYKNQKAKVSTWIYTIARNSRIDALRRNKHQDSTLDIDEIWEEQTSEDSPLLDLQQQRSKKVIGELLNQLQEDQRQVLFKVYMEGKSHSEISEDLDIPLGTVKSRVRLAMKKLAMNIDR
jgi:RNA polymerase sigma-70 factor (ECF subfamily)